MINGPASHFKMMTMIMMIMMMILMMMIMVMLKMMMMMMMMYWKVRHLDKGLLRVRLPVTCHNNTRPSCATQCQPSRSPLHFSHYLNCISLVTV